MRSALLILWAGVATVLAVLGQLREPPPGRSDPARGAYRERERASRLERKVRELEAALATQLEPAPEDRDDLAMLVEADRILQEDENWTAEKAQAIARKIYARVSADAAAHLELVRLLREAEDPDRILGYLLENPFAGLVRSADVTKAIREEARALLRSPVPHVREAGVRVLFGYADPSKADVLAAIGMFGAEADVGVHRTLVEHIAGKGREVGLTEEEARPFLALLREEIREGDLWSASFLADWSSEAEDYDLLRSALQQDPVLTLHAFRRDSRMVGPRVEECRALLLGVLQDAFVDVLVRDHALDLLKGYAPWDRETADAIARATR